MLQFAEQFPNKQIVVTLSRQLTWSLVLLPLETIEAKLFYAEQIVTEYLGVRELRKQIATKAYERTQIANAQLSSGSNIPVNTFKDPYIFDFFELKDAYLEKDLSHPVHRSQGTYRSQKIAGMSHQLPILRLTSIPKLCYI
jgi:hypothetical protein